MRTALVCLLLVVPAVAHAGPATKTLAGVKAFYAGVKQYTAEFEQEVVNKTFGTSSTSKGTVKLAPKQRMRWDYRAKRTGKVNKEIVSNGKAIVIVEHDNKQIIAKRIKDSMLPVATSFLHGKGDLEKSFDADLDTSGTYGGKDDTVVVLTPQKAHASVKTLYLVVDKGGSVSETIVVASSGDENHFRFSKVDTKTAIPASAFKVKRPKGYKIIK